MSTSIATGVDDLPCFIAFCFYDPSKLSNFSLHLSVYFFVA